MCFGHGERFGQRFAAASIQPMKTGLLLAIQRIRLDYLLGCVATALAAAVTLAAFGKYDWRLDLFSHWRMHYVGAAGILLPIFLFRRRHLSALVAMSVLLLNVASLRSAVPATDQAGSDSPTAPGSRQVRVVHFNVLFSNSSFAATLDWLQQVKPDVVVLLEFTERWGGAIRPLKTELPYCVEDPDDEGGGIALCSRYPFRESSSYRVGDMSKSAVRVTLAVDRREVTVIAAHPWPPTTGSRAREQKRYLTFIESLMRQVNGPLIVAGDLNTTPWSHLYTEFVEAGGLTERQALPTWPADFGFLGIPIDHVLGRAVTIKALSTGPNLGSDHRPLLADIGF